MAELEIPWSPRLILAGRTFRLPVKSQDGDVTLEADGFQEIASRWSEADSATYYYLRCPDHPGEYTLRARQGNRTAAKTLTVCALDGLREIHEYGGATWPRRWPVGKPFDSTKSRQTLQTLPEPASHNEEVASWWSVQPDDLIWDQLPPAELPRAHFVNAHQGCPSCGTAVFRYGGFYPWLRNHMPCDFRSRCPSCDAVFPSNDLTAHDFTSGDHADDGYGTFDDSGNLFLFAATYLRDQVRAFGAGIRALTGRLRSGAFDDGVARRLGLMLLRYALEECYLASAVQFRFGPSRGVEEPWSWGQTDWARDPDPVAALAAKGSIRYSIDTPKLGEILSLAYDTVWPLMREDRELTERARALGLPIESPRDACLLVEEMLATVLQCILDRGAQSNLPRESVGALVLLRCLDRPDAQSAMDWLFDEGPDTLRVFTTNDFFPDGTPPESSGGYNSIHTDGLFEVEHNLRQFRAQHPQAYPVERYPSLVGDPRTPHIARQPHEITVIGKSYFQFGDGNSPGSGANVAGQRGRREGSIRLEADCFHAPMASETLDQAAEWTADPIVQEIRRAKETGRHRAIGSTVHDGVGLAILRTPEAPERAAAGIFYGDTTGHRHRDLLDVQLFAFGRPFLADLGYPQSWASRTIWEDHWATHNAAWGELADGRASSTAGRGRLLRSLCVDGLQLLDVEARRSQWDEVAGRWVEPGVTFRRLIGLLETDGEGVALIDFSRVAGGACHWRTCRGLEGSFQSSDAGLQPRAGTVADPAGGRGDTGNLSHPDHTAFAYMDEVAAGLPPPTWEGTWQSEVEPGVCLDLYQINADPGAELLSARATAVMGTPEESNYCHRALIWRRTPEGTEDTTSVDLVFEPRASQRTLATVRPIRAASGAAGGVSITTCEGRELALYWAPNAAPDDATDFDDGTRLEGVLAAVLDGDTYTAGAGGLQRQGKTFRFDGARQTGRITAIDRSGLAIDVEGIVDIEPGDRVVINPSGRGHSYRVEAVESTDTQTVRLRLDVTSVLGRSSVASVDGDVLGLDFPILARTGNLNGTRVQAEPDGAWAGIASACNPTRSRTRLQIDPQTGDPEAIGALEPGTWVQVVDYVVGDEILYEPVCRG